jgi:hypothetical protein
MIIGQSMKSNATSSPNYNTTSKKTKSIANGSKRAALDEFKLNPTSITNLDANIQNFNAALRNDFA